MYDTYFRSSLELKTWIFVTELRLWLHYHIHLGFVIVDIDSSWSPWNLNSRLFPSFIIALILVPFLFPSFHGKPGSKVQCRGWLDIQDSGTWWWKKKEIKKIYYELPIEQQKNIISNIFQKIWVHLLSFPSEDSPIGGVRWVPAVIASQGGPVPCLRTVSKFLLRWLGLLQATGATAPTAVSSPTGARYCWWGSWRRVDPRAR